MHGTGQIHDVDLHQRVAALVDRWLEKTPPEHLQSSGGEGHATTITSTAFKIRGNREGAEKEGEGAVTRLRYANGSPGQWLVDVDYGGAKMALCAQPDGTVVFSHDGDGAMSPTDFLEWSERAAATRGQQ